MFNNLCCIAFWWIFGDASSKKQWWDFKYFFLINWKECITYFFNNFIKYKDPKLEALPDEILLNLGQIKQTKRNPLFWPKYINNRNEYWKKVFMEIEKKRREKLEKKLKLRKNHVQKNVDEKHQNSKNNASLKDFLPSRFF